MGAFPLRGGGAFNIQEPGLFPSRKLPNLAMGTGPVFGFLTDPGRAAAADRAGSRHPPACSGLLVVPRAGRACPAEKDPVCGRARPCRGSARARAGIQLRNLGPAPSVAPGTRRPERSPAEMSARCADPETRVSLKKREAIVGGLPRVPSPPSSAPPGGAPALGRLSPVATGTGLAGEHPLLERRSGTSLPRGSLRPVRIPDGCSPPRDFPRTTPWASSAPSPPSSSWPLPFIDMRMSRPLRAQLPRTTSPPSFAAMITVSRFSPFPVPDPPFWAPLPGPQALFSGLTTPGPATSPGCYPPDPRSWT
ncbi:uncharacterized protein LOC127549152 [Antechinus flavipes]|uniref:uncharacterized protein LOC127549152 n=1 Tax=Antechinus flavipes TaxID=38775 RepID=UPI0022360400|nr:uncharacterized protein LOC127549152 [Antechinus flavipes]